MLSIEISRVYDNTGTILDNMDRLNSNVNRHKVIFLIINTRFGEPRFTL